MNIPDLRFRGFEDEWEERVFSEVFDFSVPNNTLSRADLDDEPGSVRNIHYGDILTKYESCVDVSAERIPYIKNATCSEYNNQFLEDGDVVISDTAEDQAVGKAVEVTNVRDQYVTAGLHTIACRPFRETPPGYWGYYLNSDSFHSQLLPLMQGIKVLSINKTNLSKTNVKFPTNYQAQELIGAFFYSLDSFLQFHTRRQTKLLNLKRALLDKMFPKDGNDVPEIRFAGFDGAWETREIQELSSISTGKSNTQDKNDNGKYPFYVRSPIIERSNKYLYDEEAVLTVGDGVGTGKVFHYVNGKYDLHQRVYRMYNFRSVTGLFFYYNFSINFYSRVMSMTAKTSVDSVRLEMIAEMKIKIPTVEEQIRIADFFSHLDTLISLESQKLSKLRQLKKALLKRMFV